MKRFILTQTAEAELAQILEYIAQHDGIDRALRVHAKFADAFDTLASSPRIGSLKPHLTPKNIRWWPVFKFLIVYDASSSPLTILRVIHGARDLARLFLA